MTINKHQTSNDRLAGCDAEVGQAIAALISCYEREKIAGLWEWGSAADAEHIVGEMMKDFVCPAACQTPTRQN